jgi:hypothetical protein
MYRLHRLLAACVVVALTIASSMASPDPFKTAIQPFLDEHCMNCHDEDTARAGFRLDTLDTDFTKGNNAGLWKEVMDQINSGQMPPKKKARPDPKMAFAVSSWVAQQLELTNEDGPRRRRARAAPTHESRRVC